MFIYSRRGGWVEIRGSTKIIGGMDWVYEIYYPLQGVYENIRLTEGGLGNFFKIFEDFDPSPSCLY